MKNNQMFNWAKDLFPICRSITGEGVRKTLNYCKKIHDEIKIKKISCPVKKYMIGLFLMSGILKMRMFQKLMEKK